MTASCGVTQGTPTDPGLWSAAQVPLPQVHAIHPSLAHLGAPTTATVVVQQRRIIASSSVVGDARIKAVRTDLGT